MADKQAEMTLADIDAELARRGVAPPQSDTLKQIDAELARRGVAPPQSDTLKQIDAELARRQQGRPSPANAGLAKFGATALGSIADTGENIINLGISGANAAYRALPSYPLVKQGEPAELLHGSVGGSRWIEDRLRATGVPALNPDNPNPQDRLGTIAYEQTARGGFIPGGVLPAAASIAAERLLGPQWAGPASLMPAAIGQAARSIAVPPKTPEAKMLADEGVQLTPGQARGGAVKRVEDAATSVPIVGDAIKGAQRRGMEQYTRASINRALRPIGEKLPENLTGNKAIDYAYGKLGDKYDDLLPNLRGDLNHGGAASLRTELDSLRNLGQNLPEPQRGQLGRIIDKEIIDRFTPQGMASGETLKEIESKLGGLKTSFRKSDNYDVRSLGDAVDEMQSSLRRMVERVNPQHQGELAAVNEGYANFKRSQRAASSVGAAEGVFTPAQLHRAVRASDQSKDKARFAEGNALMQDLSSAGKQVLPSTVPDSGTPFRAAVMYALSHPAKAAGLAIPASATAAAYSPAGLRLLSGKGGAPLSEAAQQKLLGQAILAEQQSQPTLEEWFRSQ